MVVGVYLQFHDCCKPLELRAFVHYLSFFYMVHGVTVLL